MCVMCGHASGAYIYMVKWCLWVVYDLFSTNEQLRLYTRALYVNFPTLSLKLYLWGAKLTKTNRGGKIISPHPKPQNKIFFLFSYKKMGFPKNWGKDKPLKRTFRLFFLLPAFREKGIFKPVDLGLRDVFCFIFFLGHFFTVKTCKIFRPPQKVFGALPRGGNLFYAKGPKYLGQTGGGKNFLFLFATFCKSFGN